MHDWTATDLLPGLYVAALAGLLAVALRRWYDPLPRAVLALFVAAPVVLFAPALFGGKTLLPVDALLRAPPFHLLAPPSPPGNPILGEQALVGAPAQAAVRRALAAGEWPLTDPDAGAGAPLLTAPVAQVFSPLVAAAYPFTLTRAAGVTAALKVIVALAFTFLLLRRDGADPSAALVGAFAYGLGGSLLLWLGWPLATAAALAPALLYSVALATDRGERRDFALLAAAVGSVLLAGDPNAAGYALLTALAYLLARLAERFPAAERGRPFLAQALAAALAAALVAPIVWPTARAPETAQDAALATRAERDLAADPLGLATLGASERRGSALAAAGQRLLAVAAPGAFGDDRFGAYWGPTNVVEDASASAGAAALLAALLAAGTIGRRVRRRVPASASAGRDRSSPSRRLAAEGLFLGLAVACLAVVAWPQAVAPLLDRLPLLSPSPVYHRRLAMVLNLAVAYLAAAGASRLAVVRGRRRALVVAAVAAGLAAVVVWAYLGHPPPPGVEGAAARHRGRLAIQVAALVLAGAALIAASRRRGGGASRDGAPGEPAPAGISRWQPAGLAVALVVAGELLLLRAAANPAMPRRLAYPTPPAVDFLQRAAAIDPRFRVGVLGDALPPQLATVYDLTDPRFAGPSRPQLYGELTAVLVARGGEWGPLFARPLHPLWDLLGVRYLLTRPEVELGPPLALRFADAGGRVYERPHSLPRLFLPRSAEVFRGGRWQDRVWNTPDFLASALVQPAPGHDQDWTAPAAAPAKLVLGSLAATHLPAAATLAGERLLATSIYQDGGWRVLVDGVSVPTLLANGPLLAAWLPAGAHRVDLLYRPRGLLAGALAAALALAAAAAWWGAPGAGSPWVRRAAR